jgi:hypothetical protein
MEVKYVAACEAKKAVWLRKFLADLSVMRVEQYPITLFCDNSGAVAQSSEVFESQLEGMRVKCTPN